MLADAATLQAKLEDAELKIAELRHAILGIRKAAPTPEIVRDICDQALATWADEPAPVARPIPHRSSS